MAREKSAGLGTSSKPKAPGLPSLCQYCNEKAFLQTIMFFYFYFLTSIKEIETVFFPKHSPLMRCQKVKQKSQTLVSNIRRLYSNYNDPMCLGFHYLE